LDRPAEADGAAAGFCYVDGEWLDELWVRKPFQGRGIGSALVRHAETLMREAGVARARLSVLQANARAIAHRPLPPPRLGRGPRVPGQAKRGVEFRDGEGTGGLKGAEIALRYFGSSSARSDAMRMKRWYGMPVRRARSFTAVSRDSGKRKLTDLSFGLNSKRTT
jgi:hypothetical protein